MNRTARMRGLGATLIALGLFVGGGHALRAADVVWDEALIVGHTQDDRVFFRPGEEMVFTLRIEGAKGTLPPNAYFVRWKRLGDDGKVEEGRVPASLTEPFEVRTKLEAPGFVYLLAEVVDAKGKVVPKNHRWEKRVFFGGGAGVEPEKLRGGPEPKDFDAHWQAEKARLAAQPMEVLEKRELPCQNPKLRLYAVKVNVPDGHLPMTGYMAVPKAASSTNRVRATVSYMGYANEAQKVYSYQTNSVNGIRLIVNRHGEELGNEDPEYRKQFKTGPRIISAPYFRGMVFRDLRALQFVKSLPEWNGVDLTVSGTSGGGMQSIWMAALDADVSRLDVGIACCGDLSGDRFGRLRATFRPTESDDLAYYDICNFARRVWCDTKIFSARLGDRTSPPASLAIVYNNLRGRKQITWDQGWTHGWEPKGMSKTTVKSEERCSVPSADWNGRLWIVSGSEAAARRLEQTGAAVVRYTPPAETAPLTATNRWREIGYLRTHRAVVGARRETAARYGRAPARVYFLGVGAAGGNAALHEAQQFPEDVDGVMAVDPEIASAAGRPEGAYLNAANPDLHAFRRRGGKLVVRAPTKGARAARLCGYRDRVFEIAGSALRAGRFFAFALSDDRSAEALGAAADDLVAWCERGVAPRENAGFDDRPVPATATGGRFDFKTHTLAEAHADETAPADPFDFIRARLAKGEKAIRVPTARYAVAPKAKLGGARAYLVLRGLSDVTIDFGGSELVGLLRTRVVDAIACTNLTLRGLTVDFAELPFTQGEIVKVDGEGAWDVRILDGYPAPPPTGQKGESKSHDDFWPLQAYDARTTDWVNPMRYQKGVKIVQTGPRTYRVTGGQDRRGARGDIAVWSLKDRANPVVGETMHFRDSPRLRCEDITFHSTPHGRAFVEFDPDGSVFSGCRIIRRPPETDLCRREMRRLRSGNHDGIISKGGLKGPRIEDCQFTYHCDDCVNVSGQYSVFSRKEGPRTWRVLDNWLDVKLRIGSKLQILTFDGRTLTNEVTVLAREDAGPVTDEERTFMTEEAGLVFELGKALRRASLLTVDSDVDPGRYAAIASEGSMCNGFVITNCVFGYSRARGLLLKGSHGEVRDSLIVRTSGSGIAVTTEYSWLSGGCASDLEITGNTLWQAGDRQISVGGDVGFGRKVAAQLQPGAHHDIRIRNNRLVGRRGILLQGCGDCDIRDNALEIEGSLPIHRLWLQNSDRIASDIK